MSGGGREQHKALHWVEQHYPDATGAYKAALILAYGAGLDAGLAEAQQIIEQVAAPVVVEALAGQGFGYPPGYQDPPWDGSEAQFRDVVLPARIAALQQSANDHYRDVLPPGMRFEYTAAPREDGNDG